MKGGKKWTLNYEESKENIFGRINSPGKQMRNVCVIPETTKLEKWNPNPKPWELLRRIILLCSKKGDIVFDLFVSDGTSAFVANDL